MNGPASDTAANIALACDVTLASNKAYFSQIFSHIGLIPDAGGTYFLPKNIGFQKAHYLAFTGKKISAIEAEQMGMIADVFPMQNLNRNHLKPLKTLWTCLRRHFGLPKGHSVKQ